MIRENTARQNTDKKTPNCFRKLPVKTRKEWWRLNTVIEDFPVVHTGWRNSRGSSLAVLLGKVKRAWTLNSDSDQSQTGTPIWDLIHLAVRHWKWLAPTFNFLCHGHPLRPYIFVCLVVSGWLTYRVWSLRTTCCVFPSLGDSSISIRWLHIPQYVT